MGDPTAEVQIKLVVDDQSAETLEKVKAGLHETGNEAQVTSKLLASIDANIASLVEHSQHVAKGSGDIAHEVAKGNLEFEIMKKGVELVGEGIKVAWEFTEKLTDASLEAAEAAEKQEKEMAGFLFLMDQGNHSMAELRDYTKSQREEFEEFGLTAGVAVKDLVESYDKLIARGTMSSEKAKELTEQMAIVGRVVPGGMGALAQGMAGVEMGMVRARNPIVQLIAATHTLHGTAKDVAKQMQHMTPEQQMKLAEQSIAKQAESLKKMGAIVPDMGQLKTSFEGVKEGFLKSMGTPMMEALVPNLVKLRDFLARHMEEIKAFGEKVGAAAADAIEYVGSALDGIWSGLSMNWTEFKATFNEIFQDWEAAWGTSRQTSGEIKKDFETIGIALKDAFLDIAKIIKATVEVAMNANDILHGRAAGTTQAQMQGTVVDQQSMDPKIAAKEWDKSIDKYRALAEDAGMSGAGLEKYIEALNQQHQRTLEGGEVGKADVASHNWDKVNEDLAYNAEHHQDAMNVALLEELARSDEGARAIFDKHIHISESLGDLSKMIAEATPELAAKLRDMGNVVKHQGGIKPAGPVQNFYGGVHVKQDFRDQDPDSVLLVFKKGLANAAVNRTTSRSGTPFGW